MTDERPEVLGRDWRVEGNDTSGYVGVGDEYRNYANSTEKPYLAPGELAALHQRGQVTDQELEDARVGAALFGVVVEPQALAGQFDPEEDRKFTNVDVPEGVVTKDGETSYGQTVDADGNIVEGGFEDDEEDSSDIQQHDGFQGGPEPTGDTSTSSASDFSARKI